MIRKSLFWGLTLVLLVALVSLIIRGRRMEKGQAGRLVEVTQESPPSATRVLAPQDLQIVQSTTQLQEEPSGKRKSQTARHEIEIRNNGNVPYGRIQFRFDYLDRSRKTVATRNYSIVKTIMPGAALKLADIKADGIPALTASCTASVVYADIGHTPGN